MRKVIVSLIVLTTFLVTGIPSAQAWTQAQKDKVHKQKSATYVVHGYESPAVLQTTMGTHSNPWYCRTAYVTVTDVSKLGFHVWSFGDRSRFCYDGLSVTSVSWNPASGDTASWTNWNWIQADTYIQGRSGGVGQDYIYRRWASHFTICILWYCVNKHPWVGLTLRKDGTSVPAGNIDGGVA